MVRSDILDRAVPWTRMIIHSRHLPADLNLDPQSRAGAALAWIGLGLLLKAAWQPWLLVAALAALGGVLALHRRLYAFMYRHGGALFALGAVALHLLYLLYSSATFGLVAAHALLKEHLANRVARGQTRTTKERQL